MGNLPRLKLVIILYCLLSAGYLYAEPAASGGEFVYDVSFSSAQLSLSKLEGYDVARLPECIFTRDVGKPQVPYRVVHIAVEQGKRLDKIEILGDSKEEIAEEVMLYPAQASVRLGEKRDFTPPDPAVYNSSRPYPKQRFEIKNSGSLSGIDLVTFHIYPLEYIPAQKKLFLHTQIKLRVTFKAGRLKALSSKLKPVNRSQKVKRDLLDMLKKNIANTAEAEKQISQSSGVKSLNFSNTNTVDYLIITSEAFKASGAFQPLIDSKIGKGLSVEIESVEAIGAAFPGRDLQEKIRNFIKKKFSENGVLWVLLGGDTNIIPARIVVEGHETIPCDMYYSDLDGDWDTDADNRFGELFHDEIDFYPDVFVGRAPVETETEARIFVQKVLTYEANIHEYAGKALFLGYKGFDDLGGRVNDFIAQEYLPKGFGIVTKYYERDIAPYSRLAIQAINEGYHLINHIGHASETDLLCSFPPLDQITIGDVDKLTNTQAPAILWASGCSPAAIDDDCIGEHWITNPDGGGAAFIGNSRWSPIPESFEDLPSAFYESLFRKGLTHIGQTLAGSTISFIADAKNGAIGMRRALFILNLLGDPEMEILIDKGSQLAISSPVPLSYLHGKVEITGSAYLREGFKRYELYSAPKNNPGQMTLLYASAQALQNGLLTSQGPWDTSEKLNDGTPKFPDGAYLLILKIVTSDGKAIECRNKTEVIVDNYNQAPEFFRLINQGAVINRPLEFKIKANDLDDPQTPWGRLDYLPAANLPPGAQFNPQTQVFSWQPTDADKGIYKVTFSVKDSQYTVSKTITVSTVVIEESKLTNTSRYYDSGYDLYEDKIVWAESGFIYLRDLSQSAEERLLTAFTEYGYGPVIYKDKIVFADSKSDIYLYDLSQSDSDNPQRQLICKPGSINVFSMDFYENKIVWEDYTKDKSGIYMYDLANPNPEGRGTPICLSPVMNSRPAIYGNTVVWINGERGKGDIWLHGRVYVYDLANPQQAKNGTPLNNLDTQEHPGVYGSKIVWEDFRNGNRDIYIYDLATRQEKAVTSLFSRGSDPAIYADKIVWKDRRNDYGDIYLYDISSDMEVRITDDIAVQRDPKIFKDKICWIDRRSDKENAGLNDIYLARIIFVPQVFSVNLLTLSSAALIKIQGRDFGEIQSAGKVFIDGINASIQKWSDREIICNIPGSVQRGLIEVETEGGTSNTAQIGGYLYGAVFEQAQGPRGIIYSQPLAGAKLKLVGNSVNKEIISAKNGLYVFTDLPVGDYTLIAHKAGYKPQIIRIAIACNQSAKRIIYLNRLSFPMELGNFSVN